MSIDYDSMSDDEIRAAYEKAKQEDSGSVDYDSMSDDEIRSAYEKARREDEYSRKVRKYNAGGMIGEGRTFIGTDENGADVFDYDAEHAPAFAPDDDEGKAIHEKVKGYKGATLSHSDRPFRVNRGKDGKVESYSTTESTVVEELDGTWSVIPTLWKGEDGSIESAIDDEDAARHYRDTELRSPGKPGEKVGERFGNFATKEEAKAAAEDIHQLHARMYQQKWNQYINEHWDEIGDEIKGFKGMKEAHEAWEKAGRPGVRFSMSEPEDRAEDGDVQDPKGDAMGVGEHARISLQAKTGNKYSTAGAVLRYMAPFGMQAEGIDANAKTAALEKLRSGDFKDDEAEDIGRKALGAEYDEIMRVTAGGQEGKRREYLSMAATDALVEQTRNKQDANRELDFRPQTTWGKIASGFIENAGYGASFIYGSVVMPAVTVEGAAGWGLIGRNALNTVIRSAPVAVAGGVERSGDLMNKSYEVDSADNLKVIDNNYGELRSIFQGGAGSVAENVVVEGLTDVAIDSALLGISKIPFVRSFVIEPLKRAGASAVRRMMQSGGGRFLMRTGRIYGQFKNITQVHSIPSEQLEEIIQPIFDDVIGLDKKKGEKSKTLGEYAKDMFTLQNQADILCGLIGSVVVQGVGSAALARRPKQFAKDVKTARQQLVDAGADSKQVAALDDESALQCANAYVYMSQSPENLKKFTDKLDSASQYIMEQVMAREGANFGASLEGMGVQPRSFTIPTRKNAETGKVEPDFRRMKITNMSNGEEAIADRVIGDDETGVFIIDRGEKAGNSRFSVWSLTGSADFMSIAAARQYATNRMREVQLYTARDAKKAQYIENERREKFGNANVEQYRTVDEALEASRAHGVDVGKDRNFNRDRKGWHIKDAAGNGIVILVRNNISSPWQVQRVLRHEVVGHSETANGVTFLDEAMRGSNDARKKVENSLANGPVPGGIDRAIREGVANTIQQRSHHASGLQKRISAVRGWLRKHGFENLGMSESEFEARVEQIEKEMSGGNGSFEIGKTFSPDDYVSLSEIKPESQSPGRTGSQTSEAPSTQERGENPAPTASAEAGQNKETHVAPIAPSPVFARPAASATAEAPKKTAIEEYEGRLGAKTEDGRPLSPFTPGLRSGVGSANDFRDKRLAEMGTDFANATDEQLQQITNERNEIGKKQNKIVKEWYASLPEGTTVYPGEGETGSPIRKVGDKWFSVNADGSLDYQPINSDGKPMGQSYRKEQTIGGIGTPTPELARVEPPKAEAPKPTEKTNPGETVSEAGKEAPKTDPDVPKTAEVVSKTETSAPESTSESGASYSDWSDKMLYERLALLKRARASITEKNKNRTSSKAGVDSEISAIEAELAKRNPPAPVGEVSKKSPLPAAESTKKSSKGELTPKKADSTDGRRNLYAEERGGKVFRHRVENGRLLNKPPTKNVRRPGKNGGFKTQFVGEDPAVEVLNHIYDGLNGDGRRRMNELLFGEYPVGTSRVGNDAVLDTFNEENGTEYTIEEFVDELISENSKFEKWVEDGALSLEEEEARDAEDRERSEAEKKADTDVIDFPDGTTDKQRKAVNDAAKTNPGIVNSFHDAWIGKSHRGEGPLFVEFTDANGSKRALVVSKNGVTAGAHKINVFVGEGKRGYTGPSEKPTNAEAKTAKPAAGKTESPARKTAKKPSISMKSEAEEKRVDALENDLVADFDSEDLEIARYANSKGSMRQAKSIEEAGRMIREENVIGKQIVNSGLGLSAIISGRDLDKMMSEKAAKKSVSPRLHALAVANVDHLFETATLQAEHPDSHGRREVLRTLRLGSVMFDDKTQKFVPAMLTVVEYLRDGRRVYTVEAVDVGKYENSAGQLVAVANGERQTPIAEFVHMVAKLADKVNMTVAEIPNGVMPQSARADFDTEEFDVDRFQSRVGKMTKLVMAYRDNGVADFNTLATRLSEKFPEKWDAMRPYLRGIWNVVAEQLDLEEVSKKTANEIYATIDAKRKETDDAKRVDSDTGAGSDGDHVNGSDEGVPAGADKTGEGILASGLAGRQNSDERVDGGQHRRIPRRAQRLADQTVQEEKSSGLGEATGEVESVGDSVGHGLREHASQGDSGSHVVSKAANKAAKPRPGSTDFVMTPAVEAAIVEKSPIKRVRNNVAAIRLVQELKQRDFKATPEEQEVLAKYVGWGGLSEIFSRNYERAYDAEKAIASGGHAWVEPEAEIRAAKYGREGYEAYKEIRQTLNDDEYASAKRTVLTAFYTPIQMVRAEHAALRKLGVLGGRVLGPSAGVGNYASAAGEYKKGLDWQFVELDEVSGNILRALFPNQLVHVGGFEETKFADSFFDFAIDNVPYTNVDISDKSLMKSPLKIHDYFFAKTLSKIRPGGVIMFLTSTGTLDKTNGVLRQFLSKNGGKIVGAVRLPNGFFSANAGTDVASDLVVIQKVDGEADNSSFMKQEPYGYDTEYVRRKGMVKVPLTYNGYFKEHPEQVIGEMKDGTGQSGRPVLEYRMPKGDMFAKVGDAIDRAMSGIDRDMLLKNVTPAVQKDHTPVYDSEGLRQGNVTVKDGTVYEKSGTELSPVALPKQSKDAKKRFMKKGITPQKVVERIVGVRKALRAVVDAEVAGVDDENLSGLLKNLNDVYDSFAKDVGWFHDPSITPFVLLDKADGNRLMALENKRKVDGKDVLEKADIFKRRVIFTYQKPTKAETTDEALVISYSETGAIDMERIGGLLGVSAEEAEKRLKEEGKAFENPQTGRIEPYWEYLSGHVRRKLDAARAAVQSDAAFKKNVEELEKVQPKDVSLDEVKIKFGNTWVDTEAMVDFLREAYGLSKYARMSLKRSEITNKWSVELPRTDVQPFGSISFTQQHFLENVLNSATLEVREKDPVTEKYFVLERETEAQRLAAEKLHDAFARFLRTSEKWFETSGRAFNYAMNDNVQMVLPNNILPLRAAGMSEDFIRKLGAEDREYQPAVIARGVLGGRSLCLAHCVGAGKTLEMQTIGMVGRHLGMFNKSMYVVPNHMLDQFCNEFLGAFPNANILKMSTEDVSPKNRRAFFAKVANGDWDAIVVKHSTFSQKLPMTVEWQKQFIQREIDRLVEAKLAAKGDNGTVKDIERMVAKAEEKIKKLDSSDKKDSEIVPFEELGVDQLFVDEAHNFKGLPVMSMQARKTKGLQQNDSQRALDMEMKATYVQSLHGGKRGVVFATGTPLSNAPVVEAYVMLRYLSPWAMKEQDVNNFDDFVNTFGNIETVTAFGTDGKSTHEEQRITSFVNIPEMMRLFKGVVDIVNSDQIKVPRPAQKMEPVAVPMSDAQAKIMEMVAEESAKPVTKEDQGKFLTLTQIAKLACISPRLVGIEDDGKKLVACASKVKEVYDETGSDNGAQLVFTDIFNNSDAAGVQKYVGAIEGLEHSSKSWNLNKHLKDLLVASGIPAEQIAIIHDIDKEKGEESKDAAKEKIFAKVRSGEIRVLIGSRAKMGEGTNVQERLAAIHLLHPGWKPSEDTQAIGRIIRPGNMYKTGRVFYYLTQGNANVGSYETKNHELIGVKDRLINLVMHGDETVREMDLDEASVERDMLMGLASANQDLIRLIDVKRALHKAELNTESVAFSARSNADNADRTERNAERMREEFESQERGAKAWREKNPDGSFVLTTSDGRSIEKMKDMADYVSAQVVKQLQKDRYDREERLEIGSFNGIPLVLSSQFSDGKMYLSIPSIGYAREISYSGFLPDFNAQSMTAFRGRVLGETAADIEDVHKDRLDEMARRVKKLREDAARFNAEYEQEKGRLSGLRTEKARLERSVTPLIVKATENNEHVAYGNWDIRRKSGKYSAVRTTDGTRLSAPTVKALLPMMDEADFADPMKSAVKTEGIKDEGTRDVKPADVDFDTEEFSTQSSEKLELISRKFDNDLQRQIEGTLEEGHVYDLGRPGNILLSTGIPDLPIQLTANRLKMKGNVSHHPFDIGEVKGLVRHLQSPVAVFAYGDKGKAQNIIVDIQHDGKNFVVGMSLRPTVGGNVLDINSIRTVYPKDSHEWMNWITQGKLLYVDKEKIQVLFEQHQRNPGDVPYFDLDLVKSISQNFVNPQVSSSVGVPKVDFDTEELNDEERKYAESEDKTPTEDVMRDVFGMTNAEIATALRAAGMEPPKHQRKTDEQLMQQANVLLSNPGYMAKLSHAVYKVSRPVSDYENVALNVLLRQREDDVNERKAVVDGILATPDDQAAADPDYKKNLETARKELAEARTIMHEAAFAASKAATEQGRALRSNRVRLNRDDFSYAGILGSVQRELGNADVPAEIEDQIGELANEFRKLDEDERALATARLKAFSEKLVSGIRSGTKMRRAGSSRKLMDEARRVARNYADALAQIEVGAVECGGTLIGLSDQMYPAWGRWLRQLGEYHCFNNPDITEEEVIQAILEDISPFMDGVDANQVRDALTGFGHNYKQSRYESQRLMNDLRAQARMKRQLDYMDEHGKLPPKTGMIRDDLSPEARELARQVQEKKKETPEGAANSLKSALDSAKTRIRNRIEDLKRAIESGEAVERSKRSVAEDEELRKLKAEKEDLQKRYDEVFGTVGGMTEEQRIKSVEKALARALERANADLARAMSGDFSKPSRNKVDTDTANALRDEIRRIRENILDMKRAAFEYGMTPEEIDARNVRRLKAREDALNRLTERIERGDVRPYRKPQPPMTPEQQRMYDEMGAKQRKARAKLAQMRLDAQHATRPKWVRKAAGAVKFAGAAMRATMATADFSAVLRQSAVISLGHPKMAVKAFGAAWASMASEDRLAEINGEILSDSDIKEAMEKYGLNMRAVDSDDARDAEIFHGVERNTVKIRGKEYAMTDIPLFGKLLLKSERHYITYLNSVSADLYKSIVNDRVRFPEGPSPWQKKMICDLVNIWNGSGAMSKERRSALMKSGVNEVFWAPGLAVSRIQSALGYDILHNFTAEGIDGQQVSKGERVAIAKLAVGHRARFLAASVALGLLFAALKWDSGDWDEWWNEADIVEKFMMLTSPVVKNTTIDLTGGERTVTKFVHDYVKGERRTARGKVKELGKGFGVPTRTDLAIRFVRGKFSPALSMLLALADGKDYVGNEFGLKEAAMSLFPLSASDIYDQLALNGVWTTFVTAPLTLLGAGGTTYER